MPTFLDYIKGNAPGLFDSLEGEVDKDIGVGDVHVPAAGGDGDPKKKKTKETLARVVSTPSEDADDDEDTDKSLEGATFDEMGGDSRSFVYWMEKLKLKQKVTLDCDPSELRALLAQNPQLAAALAQILQNTPVGKFDPDEARDDHGRWTDGGAASKDSDVRDAFANYDDTGYEKINAGLRSGKLKGDAKENIAEMDKAFAASSTPKESMVYRYFGPRMSEMLGKLKTGDVFQDKGFVSTAMTEGGAKDFAGWYASAVLGNPRLANPQQVVSIRVPAGSKAIQMTDMVGKAINGENELLLNRGSSFRVVGPGKLELI